MPQHTAACATVGWQRSEFASGIDVSSHPFKQQGWRAVRVVASWRAPCREPLLLVSTLPPSGDLVRQYRLRAAIEALFRDWKTGGWQWEASQVRDVAHQAVLVLALATLVTLVVGEEAAQAILAQPAQTGRRRPWHARDSLVRLGRDRLWQRLWQDDTSPLTWEVAHVDAPTWATACWHAAQPAAAPVFITGRVGKRQHLRQVAYHHHHNPPVLSAPKPCGRRGQGG